MSGWETMSNNLKQKRQAEAASHRGLKAWDGQLRSRAAPEEGAAKSEPLATSPDICSSAELRRPLRRRTPRRAAPR